MGFVKFIIGLPLVLILLVFAFVNNDMANFSLWPTGIEITVSLSVAIVFLVLSGYIAGWFFTWLSYAPVRSSLRSHKKQNKKLSKEQERLVKEVEGLHGSIENLKASSQPQPAITKRDKLRKMFGFKTDESA
ncbi:MAG: LapA family protein [Alphaproteobacteria bacterium]|nr:LapA family protein [Alphaproteobacteria bacterium]